MDRNVLIGLGCAAAIATAVACRAPGQDPDAIREAAERSGGQVVVAGCLQEEAGKVVLANALLADEPVGAVVYDETTQPPPTVGGAPSTTGTIPAVMTGPSYTVQAPDHVMLQAHIGRQVQLTGMLQSANQVSSVGMAEEEERPVATTGEHEDAADPRRDADVDGHIVAEEVRLIAETCF